MYRIGWLVIGLGVLLLLSHGGFGFFFLPLLLVLLFFGFFGGRRRMVGHYGYGWGGCGGARQEWQGSRDAVGEPQPVANPEEPSYTGKTTRLS
jgi:hypothetical protein